MPCIAGERSKPTGEAFDASLHQQQANRAPASYFFGARFGGTTFGGGGAPYTVPMAGSSPGRVTTGGLGGVGTTGEGAPASSTVGGAAP